MFSKLLFADEVIKLAIEVRSSRKAKTNKAGLLHQLARYTWIAQIVLLKYRTETMGCIETKHHLFLALTAIQSLDGSLCNSWSYMDAENISQSLESHWGPEKDEAMPISWLLTMCDNMSLLTDWGKIGKKKKIGGKKFKCCPQMLGWEIKLKKRSHLPRN